MTRLDGRVIAVTGAAGAVGSVTAASIAKAGGHVLATDTDVRAVRATVGADRTDVMKLDVASEEDWLRFSKHVGEKWGRLDGLVTCAAIIHPADGDVERVDQEAWDRTHAVNVAGVMRATRAAIPLMRSRGSGSIVHLGSIVATRGSATSQLAYTASKGAVQALTRELAVTYAPLGVRVNTVVPGLLETPLTAALVQSPRELGRRLAHIPMGRLGAPEDVAPAVVWLLSDAAAYVTGTELVVDGGLRASFVTGREQP